MSLISQRIEALKEARQRRLDNKENCIPFRDSFPRFSKYVPGILKGVMYAITANSGIGKTQLAKYMFVYTPYAFMKANPDSNIKVKIIYFALEESRDEFIDKLLCTHLALKHNINIDALELASMYETPPSSDIFDKLVQAKDELEEMLSYIDIVDNISNPTGMYNHCRDLCDQLGKRHYVEKEFSDGTQQKVFSHYTPNDPEEYVIVIADHIGLLEPERGADNLHKAIRKWVVDYCRKQITKNWNWTVVNVHQQNADSEKMQFTYGGNSIVQKVEPSLDGLANNKEVARDHHVIFGLFAPARYGIPEYEGYNIQKLDDNFRSIKILKNRIGIPYLKLNVYFDGATNIFRELPSVKDSLGMRKMYDFIEEKRKI